jgi:signal transduction histidine kinase
MDSQVFMTELADSVKPIFEARGVSLSVHVDYKKAIKCSKGYVFIALKNILLNAAKHSFSGTTVRFELVASGKNALFSIIDQGEGIPKEALPNIFDPFFRADTARNRSRGGVGLGLSLALALIKLHEGTIEVKSTVGIGTTFFVKIPQDIPTYA